MGLLVRPCPVHGTLQNVPALHFVAIVTVIHNLEKTPLTDNKRGAKRGPNLVPIPKVIDRALNKAVRYVWGFGAHNLICWFAESVSPTPSACFKGFFSVFLAFQGGELPF